MIAALSEDCTVDVTVAICNWNRATLLRQTLEQMMRLRIPDGIDWELLVVNNNSAVPARHRPSSPCEQHPE